MWVNCVNNYKVQLIPISSLRNGAYDDIANSRVVFEVTPTFSESRTAEYAAVSPAHMPGSIQVYKSTTSRTFSIGARLVSRTSQEAQVNRRYLQTLRGWLMPYFGSTSTLSDENQRFRAQLDAELTNITAQGQGVSKKAQSTLSELRAKAGVQLTGAPPDVLYLYAYSASSNYATGDRAFGTANVNRVPVVMTSLNITYPDDVDYIPVTEPISTTVQAVEPFPVSINVEISLIETHSPNEYERFDLNAYKSGTLANF